MQKRPITFSCTFNNSNLVLDLSEYPNSLFVDHGHSRLDESFEKLVTDIKTQNPLAKYYLGSDCYNTLSEGLSDFTMTKTNNIGRSLDDLIRNSESAFDELVKPVLREIEKRHNLFSFLSTNENKITDIYKFNEIAKEKNLPQLTEAFLIIDNFEKFIEFRSHSLGTLLQIIDSPVSKLWSVLRSGGNYGVSSFIKMSRECHQNLPKTLMASFASKFTGNTSDIVTSELTNDVTMNEKPSVKYQNFNIPLTRFVFG